MLSKGKADAIRGEYDFIRRRIKSKNSENSKRILEILSKKQFQSYWGTYNRIDQTLRKQFVEDWSEDFKILKTSNEIDRSRFNDFEWEKLEMILNDPDRFYYEQEFYGPQWANMNDEINMLKKELNDLKAKSSKPKLLERLFK